VFFSKSACERARREALGPCVELTGSGESCSHLGIERVEERSYCGQHLNSVLLEADRSRRAAQRKAELDERIDRFMAWSSNHPSVWDRPPKDWQPA
jgi:hypothetical protein